MGTPEKSLRVGVVYACPEEQVLIELTVAPGTTVQQAVVQSGIGRRFPRLDLAAGRLGIFGRIVGADEPLQDGDRVEIYRPLIADPKEARRRRAGRKR